MRIYFALPELLNHLGWTQKKLAQESQISENSISKLCNNPTGIRFSTLGNICKATGYRPASLFKLDPPYLNQVDFELDEGLYYKTPEGDHGVKYNLPE